MKRFKHLLYLMPLGACLLWVCLLLICLLGACQSPKNAQVVKEYAPIFPSYADSLCIPVNIAPLHFSLPQEAKNVWVRLSCEGKELYQGKQGRKVHFSLKKWRKYLQIAQEKSLEIELCVGFKDGSIKRYLPLHWFVSKDTLDPYLVYRLVAPGDGVYHVLGLYQRDLQSFKVRPLMQNTLSENNCMNCHTYQEGNAEQMILHLRFPSEGSLIVEKDKIYKVALPPQAAQKNIRLIYPAYHPGGRFIAFSTNLLKGVGGYEVHRRFFNSIDSISRILIYQKEGNKLFTCPALWDTAFDLSYPAWSANGKRLYFCRTPKEKSTFLDSCPHFYARIERLLFDLVYIDFDPQTALFGDSIQMVCQAKDYGKSFALPRISPDGRCILVNTCSYSSFPARTDGDLGLVWLDEREGKGVYTYQAAQELNSAEAESFHTWSRSGKWVVFASKRTDGYYALPYMAHFDGKRFSRPFVLPQKDGDYYRGLLKSFNLPEFTRNASPLRPSKAQKARQEEALLIDISEIP